MGFCKVYFSCITASEDVTADSTLNLTASKTGKGRKKVAVRLVKGNKAKQTEQVSVEIIMNY